MIYAYAHYNTDTGRTKDETQNVNDYAALKGLRIDKWVKTQKINNVLSRMSSGDTLLVSYISCIGSSLISIEKTIGACLDKNIKVIIISGNYVFEDTPQNRLLLSAMGMVRRLQSELKSQTMRTTLNRLRGQGRKLGRPRGSGNKKVKLSGREPEIGVLLERKLSKTEIARRLGVNRMTLYAFLCQMQK